MSRPTFHPHNGYPAASEADLTETARLVEAEGRPCLMEVTDVRHFDALEAALADAVGAWTFGPAEATQVTAAALLRHGGETRPWFPENVEILARMLPNARTVM